MSLPLPMIEVVLTRYMSLQADFNLSYAQLGLLPALYMAGLMVACIVFNELTNHVNSFRLVGESLLQDLFAYVGIRSSSDTMPSGSLLAYSHNLLRILSSFLWQIREVMAVREAQLS